MTEVYFLTVDWCKQGRRGIFCDIRGRACAKDGEPHTEEEMWDILGMFIIILSPQSEVFTEEEVAEFSYFRPLGEYKGAWGIALREEDVPARVIAKGEPV